MVRFTLRLLYLQNKNTQFLSQKKLHITPYLRNRPNKKISTPRLATKYSKPSSDCAVMTTAPGRSVHVDFETSELKVPVVIITLRTLYPRQKSSHQHIKLPGSKSVRSEVTLRLKAVSDISETHLWNDECQETKKKKEIRWATQRISMSLYGRGGTRWRCG
jgi:hypothetical protein